MTEITPRIAAELLYREGLVTQAYRDSKGVWTWGVGVTDASGHKVGRYKDKPQPIEKCLQVYLWLLNERYLPAVLRAFDGYELSESKLGAALSFHYNTGAIGKATWVKNVLAHDDDRARANFMQYRRPPEIVERREGERDLFFDGKWRGDGTTALYQSVNQNYKPIKPVRLDVRPTLAKILGGS